MKFWMISYEKDDHPSGIAREIFTARTAAMRRKAQVLADEPDTHVYAIEKIDVPTTKKSLAAWLTVHMN